VLSVAQAGAAVAAGTPPREVSAAWISSPQAGAPEIGAPEVGKLERGAPEMGALESGKPETGAVGDAAGPGVRDVRPAA